MQKKIRYYNTYIRLTFKIFILALALVTSNAYSQWASNYSGNSQSDVNILNARGLAVATDNHGNSIVAGYISNSPTDNDILLIKYNSNGDTVWTRTFKGDGNEEDRAWGIVVDDEDNIYIGGTITLSGRGKEVIVMKYNRNGVLKWHNTWGATNQNKDDGALSIALDDNGNNVYITGYCTNNNNTRSLFVQKYATGSGALRFTKIQNPQSSLNSEGYGIVVDSDNNIYVTGFTQSVNQSANITTSKYSASGSLGWTKLYDGEGAEDKAFGIAVDDADNVYIAGYITAGSNTDAVVLKYNQAGSLRWDETYDGTGNNSEDKAWGIVVEDEDSHIYITGETAGANGENDYLTVKYTKSGVRKWVKKYNGPGNGDDFANAIALTPNNKIVVTGASWGINNNHDYATIKYNKNGNEMWVSRYSMTGSTNDIAKDVAVADNNNQSIFVTGFSELIVDGNSTSSSVSTVMILSGDKDEVTGTETPSGFALYQNYPNPFNPSTTIRFDLPEASAVRLVVYDMLGKTVDILVNQSLPAGSHNITYTNKNLSSGIYFYELQAGGYKEIRKMTLVK